MIKTLRKFCLLQSRPPSPCIRLARLILGHDSSCQRRWNRPCFVLGKTNKNWESFLSTINSMGPFGTKKKHQVLPFVTFLCVLFVTFSGLFCDLHLGDQNGYEWKKRAFFSTISKKKGGRSWSCSISSVRWAGDFSPEKMRTPWLVVEPTHLKKCYIVKLEIFPKFRGKHFFKNWKSSRPLK